MSPRPFAMLAAVVLSACGGPSGAPGSGNGEVITGVERFGWDQPAPDAGELGTFRYAIYVDSSRTEAVDVSCGASSTSGRFTRTCPLPRMAAGSHTPQV